MNKIISVAVIFFIALPVFIIGLTMLISEAQEKRDRNE